MTSLPVKAESSLSPVAVQRGKRGDDALRQLHVGLLFAFAQLQVWV